MEDLTHAADVLEATQLFASAPSSEIVGIHGCVLETWDTIRAATVAKGATTQQLLHIALVVGIIAGRTSATRATIAPGERCN